MVFFKNADIETTVKIKIKNEVGQLVEAYTRGNNSIRVNIQPIDIQAIKYTWGEDIKSQFQMYADALFSVGDIIIWQNKTYEIEKHIPWISYNLYAIKDKDVVVNA
ncbi:hypothetical protein [Clostridium culturomicium]|uniref:hypothetical protein n=1 Tax=Clostridium culturomicium TaxID=1499683 RepID=UPI00058B1E1C|nr:hypothetical protein [Clostridium culturomicium]